MKKRKGLLLILVFLVLSFSVPAFAKAKINKKSVNISVGSTVRLQVTGAKGKVKWSSTNKKVATVNKRGLVKAKKVGKATIKAKVGKKKFKCVVTVSNVGDAISAYKQFIKENYKTWTMSGRFGLYTAMLDIDKDGVDELFISYASGARPTNLVYGYDGKKVIFLCGANSVSIKPNENLILVEGFSMTEMSYTIYKKVGNAVVKQNELSELYGRTYQLNGKTITKAVFDSYLTGFTSTNSMLYTP